MPYQKPAHIETILRNLPAKPGCYLMKNSRGKIIYVGKAKRLRNRVRSYFTTIADGNSKTLRMRADVDDIDFIITENEVKALILEETLIKKHKPRYNIELKDDKRYPYIRVSWGDAFPKVETTRRVVNDGSRYFGPYSAMWVVQKTLSDLRRAFPYLTCDRDINGQDERACLFHDIKLCNAPCIGAVSRDEYRNMIQELMDVLGGRAKEVQTRLVRDMDAAAADLNFERAAAIRDQLQAIDFITNKHKAVGKNLTDHDVIALAREERDATVQIMFIRNGKLIGSDSRMMNNTEGETDAAVLEQFISQFYASSGNIPRELILPGRGGRSAHPGALAQRQARQFQGVNPCAAARRQTQALASGAGKCRREPANDARPIRSRHHPTRASHGGIAAASEPASHPQPHRVF